MNQEQNLVRWVWASENEGQLAERYDEWAETYEADLDRDFGWYGPIRAVESTIRYVKKDCRILDAGAGTGLVGKLLAKRGFDNLVAMDLSAGMLEEARKKNVYTEFYQVIMGTPPKLPIRLL